MTQTRMIVDTKSILELPMYNQENVLRYLEKDHVEMATTFKAWEEKAKGIVQNNKTKREKLNSKREKSEVQPDDQHVALTNELLDLLDGLVHHGLHQYRPTLVSKYKNLLIWKDQEKFDFLLKNRDAKNGFTQIMNDKPMIKLYQKKPKKFAQIKKGYHSQKNNDVLFVGNMLLFELLDFSRSEREQLVKEFLTHTIPNDQRRDNLNQEIQNRPAATLDKLSQRNKTVYWEFVSIRSVADYSKVKHVKEQIDHQDGLTPEEKQALHNDLDARIAKFNSQAILFEEAVADLSEKNKDLHKMFKKDVPQERIDLLKGIKDEPNLDWLTKNVLTEELVRKQVAQEKLDTYKALMSDKQLTREVVASIKQSKEYSEEIKKALIFEINPSEEAKKNNIKKISVIKQEFFIRKQLLEVLKERVATDKTYQPLFEQIEKATNSNEKQKEHVTAQSDIKECQKFISENKWEEEMIKRINQEERIPPHLKVIVLSELKESTAKNQRVGGENRQDSTLVALVLKSHVQNIQLGYQQEVSQKTKKEQQIDHRMIKYEQKLQKILKIRTGLFDAINRFESQEKQLIGDGGKISVPKDEQEKGSQQATLTKKDLQENEEQRLAMDIGELLMKGNTADYFQAVDKHDLNFLNLRQQVRQDPKIPIENKKPFLEQLTTMIATDRTAGYQKELQLFSSVREKILELHNEILNDQEIAHDEKKIFLKQVDRMVGAIEKRDSEHIAADNLVTQSQKSSLSEKVTSAINNRKDQSLVTQANEKTPMKEKNNDR